MTASLRVACHSAAIVGWVTASEVLASPHVGLRVAEHEQRRALECVPFDAAPPARRGRGRVDGAQRQLPVLLRMPDRRERWALVRERGARTRDLALRARWVAKQGARRALECVATWAQPPSGLVARHQHRRRGVRVLRGVPQRPESRVPGDGLRHGDYSESGGGSMQSSLSQRGSLGSRPGGSPGPATVLLSFSSSTRQRFRSRRNSVTS